MPVGKIKLRYLTKELVQKKQFDCRTIIRHDIEELRFSTSYEKGSTGISYLSAPELDPEENVLIKDNSFQVENNSLEENTEFLQLSDNFNTNHANFYITDVFKNDVPLYFWHKLPSDYEFSHLEFLKEDYTPVDPELWSYYDETSKLGYNHRGIYTNFQCKLDKKTKEYSVFYVRYKRLDTQEIVTELLDAAPFYTESVFTSTRNERKYIKNQEADHFVIQIIFDSINYSPTPDNNRQRYMIKINAGSVISIMKPAAFSPAERWYLRITPGDIKIGEKRYWVPEYYRQLFNPLFPFKKAQEKLGLRITDRLIYTDLFPIANLGIEGFFIEILIKNEENALVQVITNDPNADTYITSSGALTDIVYEKNLIESISTESGLIKLRHPLKQGRIYLNYKYIEKYLTYSKLIINPSINPDILGKRILIYCIADAKEDAIQNLILLENGLIQESSKDDLYVTVNSVMESGDMNSFIDSKLSPFGDYYSGFELEILSGDNSGERVQILSYDHFLNKITLANSLPFPLTSETIYRINKFFHSYSYRNATIGVQYSYVGWEDYAISEKEHVLGDVYVVQKIVEDDIESFDVRILGGGVKEKKVFDASTLQNEVTWYWDIGKWDGNAYPGMGALLIELPRSILKELGGSFSREQVEEMVMKHMGAGSYPLIKYYDRSTEIINIETGDGFVEVEWRKISANSFNIYIGNSSDNLTFLRKEPGTRNQIKIDGLENNKQYYIQIESVVGGVKRLRSRIVSFVPYSFVELAPAFKYNKKKYLEGTYE